MRELELMKLVIEEDGAAVVIPVVPEFKYSVDILYRHDLPTLNPTPLGEFAAGVFVDSLAFSPEHADITHAVSRIYGSQDDLDAAWATLLGVGHQGQRFAYRCTDLFVITTIEWDEYEVAAEHVSVIDMRPVRMGEVLTFPQLEGCYNQKAQDGDLRLAQMRGWA